MITKAKTKIIITNKNIKTTAMDSDYEEERTQKSFFNMTSLHFSGYTQVVV